MSGEASPLISSWYNNVLSAHIKMRNFYLMKIYNYMVLYNPTHKLVVSSLFHPLWLV